MEKSDSTPQIRCIISASRATLVALALKTFVGGSRARDCAYGSVMQG
jgi:hypothetical protein